jgi:virulence-associated protein VapD
METDMDEMTRLIAGLKILQEHGAKGVVLYELEAKIDVPEVMGNTSKYILRRLGFHEVDGAWYFSDLGFEQAKTAFHHTPQTSQQDY